MFKGLFAEFQISYFTKLTVCSGCSMRGNAKPFELQVGMPGRAEAHSTVINAKLTIALGEFGILEFLTLLKTI